MKNNSYFKIAITFGLACAAFISAGLSTGVAAPCDGKSAGYFFSSNIIDNTSTACIAPLTGKQTCTKTYSNYCQAGGSVLSIFIYQTCSASSCVTAAAPPKTTTPVATAPTVTTPVAQTSTAPTVAAPAAKGTLVYPSNQITLNVGQSVNLVPVLTGLTTGETAGCKTTPSLPYGQSINPATCVISGGTVPANTPGGTNYTIVVSGTNIATPVALNFRVKPLAFGVNGPVMQAGPNMTQRDMNALFKMLQSRGITQYRVQADLTDYTSSYLVPMFHQMNALAKTYGITINPLITTIFAYGDRTDAGRYPAGDRVALYNQGYNRAYAFVKEMKNEMNDWELGNERNLLVLDANNSPLWGKGWTAAEFDTPVENDWAAVMKGMADAIDQVNKESGTHLRKTMNTTSTMFGFLDFMASKGINFDVISYHYYEAFGVNPHLYWGGVQPNFDLFKKLGSYHKSVVINETNCGETYLAGFENLAGKPVTETCFKSFNNILNYMKTQNGAIIESVSAYELFDEPAKAGAEGKFGMMYDMNTPKIQMLLLSQYAGGTLSSSEQAQLKSRGF